MKLREQRIKGKYSPLTAYFIQLIEMDEELKNII
jgi:hypothetical protein